MRHNDRVYVQPNMYADVIVDSVTGVALPSSLHTGILVDTSGALLWRDKDDTLVASRGPDRDGRILEGVKRTNGSMFFHYGVVFECNTNRVLRFDIDPAPAAEPDRKASVAMFYLMR